MKKLLAATATPLASIFGSGFLVIVPILCGAVGKYSVFAMAVVCTVAYGVGAVIRHNIAHAEPVLANGTASEGTVLLERASDLALVAAYVISVCLYISIMAAFLLRGIGEHYDTPLNRHILSAIVIVAIGAVGYIKGLKTLARLEDIAMVVTMLIIVALLVGFAVYDVNAVRDGVQLPVTPAHSWWEILTIVGGTLIVVQGFETSRYLGEVYDPVTRITSCRLSQIVSTVVYLVFVGLATPLMHYLGRTVQDNALIMLAGKASVLLPLPLVTAAVLSQFSAAVADTFGGSGNMVEATRNHVDLKRATLLICGGAAILCFTPTLTILALASRAFAFYYLIQCLVAFTVTHSVVRRVFFILMALLLGFVAVFAIPAG
jgi:hypothetical protein